MLTLLIASAIILPTIRRQQALSWERSTLRGTVRLGVQLKIAAQRANSTPGSS